MSSGAIWAHNTTDNCVVVVALALTFASAFSGGN
jgi:hypothetical protein